MHKAAYRVIAILLILIVSLGQNLLIVRASRVEVTWFIDNVPTPGFAEQKDALLQVAETFNESQDEIQLNIFFAPLSPPTYEAIEILIRFEKPPDIVGPRSINTHKLPGGVIDLEPLARKHNYDLSQFPKALVDLHREDSVLVSLPFGALSGLIAYNADLFDAAGLAYPPDQFGEAYLLDGKAVVWNWDTVAETARRLTLDIHGDNANSADFDKNTVAQYGFVDQFNTFPPHFAMFNGAPLINSEGKVEFPERWRDAARWLHAGLQKDRFIPTYHDYHFNTLLKSDNPFGSGKAGMTYTILFYNCCLQDLKARWDIAVTPSYKGQLNAPVFVDSFNILKASKEPDAAFKVLVYLQGAGAADLLEQYRMFPARSDLHKRFIQRWAAVYPGITNWHVLTESMTYAVPSALQLPFVPNYDLFTNRLGDLSGMLYETADKAIDVEKELKKLEADLQAIVDAPLPTPTPW